MIGCTVFYNWLGQAKMCLMLYVNNKGADQPAHPHSLISTFVVRCLDTCFIWSFKSLPSFCSWESWFESYSLRIPEDSFSHDVARITFTILFCSCTGERGGSVVECRTPEREVRGSRPTSAVLCPWARHFTPRKYWLITQEAMAPSWHDWKIVDWDVKPQHNQPIVHAQ